jgi:hypothetical protein
MMSMDDGAQMNVSVLLSDHYTASKNKIHSGNKTIGIPPQHRLLLANECAIHPRFNQNAQPNSNKSKANQTPTKAAKTAKTAKAQPNHTPERKNMAPSPPPPPMTSIGRQVQAASSAQPRVSFLQGRGSNRSPS